MCEMCDAQIHNDTVDSLLKPMPRDGTPISRADLAYAVNMTADGGTFKTYMGKLISLGIARATALGFVAVEPWVWS